MVRIALWHLSRQAYNQATMQTAPQRYWFPTKRYGWGWGMPSSWQGWVVLAIWLVIVGVGAPITASHSMWIFGAFMVVMCAGITAICFAKGEPPKWRWGN
jgi:hypothetical protein